MNEQFARDVMHGLSESPKYLPSKYFYDKTGDRLFQEIMELEEYYLTRCEFEIFQNSKQEFLNHFLAQSKAFDLIEFGAGDGKKTKVLLEHFMERGADFTYKPIDISANALDSLESDLRHGMPQLKLETLQGEYFSVLSQLDKTSDRTKVVLFLGSNIGNFLRPVALDFLKQLANTLKKGDMLLLGVDLVKDPTVISKAYNDSKGITARFNLNLLHRINSELAANFDLDKFSHFPLYNPISGTSRSFLISRERQTVTIEKLNASFHFNAWEPIHTEYSHKYRLEELDQLAESSGFETVEHYFDARKYFTDGIWRLR